MSTMTDTPLASSTPATPEVPLAAPVALPDETPLSTPAPTVAAPAEPSLSEPAAFDLGAWVAGLNPARRAVTIYGRPDLQADVDLLRERMLEARRCGEPEAAEDYKQRLAAVSAELRASALDVVVQATAPELQERIKADTGCAEGSELNNDQACQFTAAHVVEPAGFTAEHVRAILDASPAQAMVLIHAVRRVNTEAVQVVAPFSPGR